jgi:hypothetical protein
LAQNTESGTLIVYVENIGTKTITINSEYVFKVNEIEIPILKKFIDKNTLEQDQIATINIPFKIPSDSSVNVRIFSNDLIIAETSVSDPTTIPCAYTIKVNIQGDSDNKVAKIPDQSSYHSGSTVNLIAESVEGWSFSDWNGDISGSDNPIEVLVDSDKVVIANFIEHSLPSPMPTSTPSPSPSPTPTPTPSPTPTPTPSPTPTPTPSPTPTPTPSPTPTPTPTPSPSPTPKKQYKLRIHKRAGGETSLSAGVYWFDEGTIVPLSATAYSGYVFEYWEVDNNIRIYDSSFDLTMSKDRSVVPKFIKST